MDVYIFHDVCAAGESGAWVGGKMQHFMSHVCMIFGDTCSYVFGVNWFYVFVIR